MQKVTTIGTGYVGLVTGAGFADLGNDVTCLDIDEKKINDLNKGILPIYEPGLEEIVKRNHSEGRLKFTTDYAEAVKNSDILFICVGTPMSENGAANLDYIYDAAESIAKHMDGYKVIVNKSTVPPLTGKEVTDIIARSVNHEFDVVSNPEFLREGRAVYDFKIPDRIVVGADNEKSMEIMKSLYLPVTRTGKPIIFTDRVTAETIKYAGNGMLATRISFMNDMANLCEKIGADVTQVAKGIGLDNRIGSKFLHAGTGYGGSCFPKDVRAITHIGKQHGYRMKVLEAVDEVNRYQKLSLLPKIADMVDIKDSTIAILGLAFKPKTDDVRDAPAIDLIRELTDSYAKIHAYDPKSLDTAKTLIDRSVTNSDRVTYFNHPFEAVHNADVAVIMTEWDQFRSMDLGAVKKLMKNPNIIDGRNIYEPSEIRDMGFNYVSVGRP